MIITYEGADYPFDIDGTELLQAMAIEKHTGMPFAKWGETLEQGGDLKVLQAFGWLVLHCGDLGVPIETVNFKFAKLSQAVAKAAADEAAKQKAAEDGGPRPTAGASTSPPAPLSGAAAAAPSAPSSPAGS